ncbi:MAG TPA: glycosyltransferase family 4 protein [Thermoleophilaceae bacterium]|nr:glycosyltransferase family 4 protein [Thermoleophilaceae bacterium]
MRIAYLGFSYPALSQTFVVREVQGLRAQGFEVETWGIRAAEPEVLRTEEYRAEAAATRALRPVRPGALARAHLRALRTAPRAYAATLVRAVRDRPPGARALGLALASFAVAIGMWADLERSGTRHLHVHFAGSPTHVAALVTAFGGPEWSWSVSVHGPVEFTDLTASRLPERLRQALFVTAISDFARSQLLALLPEDQWHKVRVVRCGIEPAAFAPEHDTAPAGGPVRILYVGRLVSLKGQPVLLDAMARLAEAGVEAELILVGDGPERDALERRAARLGLDGRVAFAGPLGQDEVREHYARADVFCLPSFAEGVPVVLMEAMAAGLPVVTTRIAGVPELVEDGVEGLLTLPGRADDLEAALTRLAADPQLRAEMGRRGRAKVDSRHDIATTAAELAELHLEFRQAPECTA